MPKSVGMARYRPVVPVKALRAAGFLRWWRQFKRKTIHGVAGLYRTASAYVFRLVLPAVSGEQQRTENAGASLATGLHLMRPIASRPRLRAFWR